MKIKEIKRLYHILKIFFKYGLIKIFSNKYFFSSSILWKFLIFISKYNKYKEKSIGLRLFKALEQLGPIWIKFGQILSTRNDILPNNITKYLKRLQNNALPFNGKIARSQIEKSLNQPLEKNFKHFNIIPLASASIAQVHTAILKKNGKKIIIKIIRPKILSLIQLDIKIMYFLANVIIIFSSYAKKLRIIDIIHEYERTLINELNLLREAVNTIQLRKNFKNSKILYFPKVYLDYCTESVLVMERIYGISLSKISVLKKAGVNMKLLAERGVKIFFTQVFRDNFFHADMHPGNIFINYKNPENPKYIGIDCGNVGYLNNKDKRYLAENFIAFFNRDYKKIAKLHLDNNQLNSINIMDFELAIRIVCEPIFEKPLTEISFGYLLLKLFNTANDFNVKIQPQFFLLQKTLFSIEGIGKQLYPKLNLWKTAKPFLENWLYNEIGIKAIHKKIIKKIPFLLQKIPKYTEIFFNNLQYDQNIYYKINKLTKIYSLYKKIIHQNQLLIILIIAINLIWGGIILLLYISKK